MGTLKARNLSKRYRTRQVVKDVSIEAKSGQIVSLLGPNGAGKTTTFYMISGLIRADSGSIFLDDRDISAMPIYQRASLGIGYLPQEASIFRQLSVYDNITAVLEIKTRSSTERRERAMRLIREFSLEHVKNTRGSELSGGERRRTEIARALAVDPRFILLDEPFAGVDPISINDTKNLIKEIVSRGIGIIITDHNVRDTLALCDLAYILAQGEVIACGTPAQITRNSQVREIYLGDDFNL